MSFSTILQSTNIGSPGHQLDSSDAKMLNKAKDKMIGTAVKRLLEEKLKRYGEVRSLSVDSKAQRMAVEFLPLGEVSPITINLDKYEIEKTVDGKVLIRLQEVTANREWVANLLEDYAKGLEYPIDGPAAKFADFLL